MLPISTKGRYASRIMVFLATLGSAQQATSEEISRHEGISAEYVQQILATLAAAGLVRARRGRGGGFSLAVNPEATSLAQVLRAVEGQIAPAPCVTIDDCSRSSECVTREVWLGAAQLLDDFFAQITIGQLARKAKERWKDA